MREYKRISWKKRKTGRTKEIKEKKQLEEKEVGKKGRERKRMETTGRSTTPASFISYSD